jgi:NADH-quinone oxidoreductase subunit E
MSQPTETEESFALSPENIAKIDNLVPRYPSKRSASLPILHIVQDEKGYVSQQAAEWVAERLEIEPIKVLELITFYPMFRQAPIGRNHVKVCRTLSCALNGGAEVCQKFKDAFDVELGEVSADGEVTVEYVECIASCGTAPVVQIGEVLHENVSEERADELIGDIRSSAQGNS